MKKDNSGKKYYNNGVTNMMIKDGVPIPEGFVLGMKKRSSEEKRLSNERRKATNLKKYGGVAPQCSKEIREKTIQTNLSKYGVENPSQAEEIKERRTNTMLDRYGVSNSMQSDELKDRHKRSVIDKYGVENVFQNEDVKEKIKQTNLERYGVEYPTQSEEIKKRWVSACVSRYGTTSPLKSEVVKSNARQTNLERYGVEWTCMRPEARKYSNDSLPNRTFAKILEKNNISYEREFYISNYSYDFKVGNYLIEVDPSVTHNLIWYPFGNHESRITEDYHFKKTNTALEAGYKCIHIFDWDDADKIVRLLQDRENIYARKCEIREVSIDDTAEFLNRYHLQGVCKGQSVRLGLYYNNELVSIMTFGKPRYNKNYEWELLRYCSSHNVIGGANKLFKYFIDKHMPKSIVSYCDRAKFIGDVYDKLGFTLKILGKPSCHWYSEKENRHITDNLLRQRGYDQLFNESYGKGTSNEELIIQRGYLPIYDCGQDVWVYGGAL